MRFGNDTFYYELVKDWGNFDPNWTIDTVPGVAVDAEDNVYILSRGMPPIAVFTKDGEFIESWGDDIFVRAHGVYICENNNVFCVDDEGHCAYRFNEKRELTMQLGQKNSPSDTGCINKDWRTIQRGSGPFNRPTNLAMASNGDIYITDGYGNARVHCFTPEGDLKFSWGQPGMEPGNFNLPHGLAIDSNNIIYVCDRQNNRIQLFTLEGKYISQWTDFIRPADCFIKDEILYVAECRHSGIFDGSPSRVTILDLKGNIITRLDANQECDNKNGSYHTAHGICVDSEGNIYVSEVGKKIPKGYLGVKKYRRIRNI